MKQEDLPDSSESAPSEAVREPHPELSQTVPKKRTPPGSLRELLKVAYAARGRVLRPKPKDLRQIATSVEVPEPLYTELQPIFVTDQGLQVAFELTLLCRRLHDRPSLRGALREFIARALSAHPTFGHSPELLASLRALPGAPPARVAFRIVTASSSTAGTEPPKKRLRQENSSTLLAIACLAAWFQETRDYPLETMVCDLNSALWDPALGRLKDDTSRLRALFKSSEEGLGVVAAAFLQRIEQQSLLAERAQRAEAQASARIETTLGELSNLHTVIAERDAAISALQSDLTAARAKHDLDLSHATDDYENLRARFIRLLREEGRLLEEGLHALRREPPKIAVTEDHCERVLDSYKRMLKHLEGG